MSINYNVRPMFGRRLPCTILKLGNVAVTWAGSLASLTFVENNTIFFVNVKIIPLKSIVLTIFFYM